MRAGSGEVFGKTAKDLGKSNAFVSIQSSRSNSGVFVTASIE